MPSLQGFTHHPGAHCGSTALNNLARFYGHPLTEPLCFGIGEGLGFMTIVLAGRSPSHLVMGRNPFLEERFFHNLGIPFQWAQSGDADQAWRAAREAIDRGVPVLLRTDLHYLDYYQSKTHFSGHVVVLAGYDERAGEAFLSDTHFDKLQTVSLEALSRARSSRHPPSPLENHSFVVDRFSIPEDLAPILRRAIAHQAKSMLEPLDYGLAKGGVPGMDHLARTFGEWAQAPDWAWCARFAYQIIERRGTGGANFRLLYARFLEEAGRWLPEEDLPRLSARMAAIADRWTELATHLKAVSEGPEPDGFQSAGERMAAIGAAERAFYTEALALSRADISQEDR